MIRSARSSAFFLLLSLAVGFGCTAAAPDDAGGGGGSAPGAGASAAGTTGGGTAGGGARGAGGAGAAGAPGAGGATASGGVAGAGTGPGGAGVGGRSGSAGAGGGSGGAGAAGASGSAGMSGRSPDGRQRALSGSRCDQRLSRSCAPHHLPLAAHARLERHPPGVSHGWRRRRHREHGDDDRHADDRRAIVFPAARGVRGWQRGRHLPPARRAFLRPELLREHREWRDRPTRRGELRHRRQHHLAFHHEVRGAELSVGARRRFARGRSVLLRSGRVRRPAERQQRRPRRSTSPRARTTRSST